MVVNKALSAPKDILHVLKGLTKCEARHKSCSDADTDKRKDVKRRVLEDLLKFELVIKRLLQVRKTKRLSAVLASRLDGWCDVGHRLHTWFAVDNIVGDVVLPSA